jgi:hypothetical protein
MNVLTVFSAMAPYIRGKNLHELFPHQFMQNLPYDRVRPGCCIICVRPMGNYEMFPPGRITPRAVCPVCWSSLTSGVTQNCLVCLDSLESWRIQKQERQLGNLHLRIHEGKCRDYFSLVSAKALGKETGIIDLPAVVEAQHYIPFFFQEERLQLPEDTLQKNVYESFAVPGRLGLPLPSEQFRFQHPLKRTPELVPAQSPLEMHKGKRVKVIRKN